VVSLLLLVRRAAYPHVAFLGRIPGTRRYSDLERNPDNEAVPGVLIFRVESGLLYFNVEHVRQTVWQRLRVAIEPVRLVVCDLSTCWRDSTQTWRPQGFNSNWSKPMPMRAIFCEPKASKSV
jgi:MFS superfamily sulfate permease-like transporter